MPSIIAISAGSSAPNPASTRGHCKKVTAMYGGSEQIRTTDTNASRATSSDGLFLSSRSSPGPVRSPVSQAWSPVSDRCSHQSGATCFIMSDPALKIVGGKRSHNQLSVFVRLADRRIASQLDHIPAAKVRIRATTWSTCGRTLGTRSLQSSGSSPR
jgi:hypothetical protein